MRILITGFEPFKGRSINGSATVVRYLEKNRLQLFPQQDLKTLILPVRWGIIESAVMPVVESWKPDSLIGLGEGKTESVSMELCGRNSRSGVDESGNAPDVEYINESGPKTAASRLNYDLAAIASMGCGLVESRDAGQYLCNNALYRYVLSEVSNAGFLHLPIQGDQPAEEYLAKIWPVIASFLPDIVG